MIRAEPRAAVLVMGKPRASGDDPGSMSWFWEGADVGANRKPRASGDDPAELTERDNIVK